MKKILLIALFSISASCAVDTVPIVLQAPPDIVLPEITDAELSCLSDPVYRKVATTILYQGKRIETLKGIIESTQ